MTRRDGFTNIFERHFRVPSLLVMPLRVYNILRHIAEQITLIYLLNVSLIALNNLWRSKCWCILLLLVYFLRSASPIRSKVSHYAVYSWILLLVAHRVTPVRLTIFWCLHILFSAVLRPIIQQIQAVFTPVVVPQINVLSNTNNNNQVLKLSLPSRWARWKKFKTL